MSPCGLGEEVGLVVGGASVFADLVCEFFTVKALAVEVYNNLTSEQIESRKPDMHRQLLRFFYCELKDRFVVRGE